MTVSVPPPLGNARSAQRRTASPRIRLISRTLNRRVNIGVALSLVAAVILGIVSYRAVSGIGRSFGVVSQTQNADASLFAIVANVRRAEAGQRGYLLTGSTEQLGEYERTVQSIPAGLTEVWQLILDEPDQRRRYRQLDSLVRRRVAVLDRVALTYRKAGLQEAQRAVMEGDGIALTAAIDAAARQMQYVERRHVRASLAEGHSQERTAFAVIISSTAAAIIMLLLAGYTINWDIAQRQEAEAQLRSAVRSADQANDAKTRFLATVSHEIRTPLNAVMGMTELLLDTKLASEQVEFARTIHTNSEALSILISDLLDSSKIDADQVDLESIPFDPVEVVDSVVEILAIRAELKGLELVVSIGSNVPAQVEGDPNRFRQVLMNLVGNAIKFTEVGEIHVEAKSTDRADGTADVTIDIHDTGIGISPEQAEKVFDRFVQADRSTVRKFGGTGLGLTISRSLAALMGGSLTVESTPGEGSVFSFRLPFKVLASSPSSLSENRGLLADRRILIVDTNHTRLRAIKSSLEAIGASVQTAASARIALENAKHETFAIAVINERLPDMSGVELVRHLEKQNEAKEKLPVILITALQSMPPAPTAGGSIVDRVYKPVRQSRLLRGIRQALGMEVRESQSVANSSASGVQSRVRPRILLVEDQRDNWVLVTRSLTSAGYKVDLAENGAIAVERAGSFRYDLVLMDIEMPLLDGFQATGAIRSHESSSKLPPVPIVALTAHAVEGFRERCLASGMDDYVTKPVKKQQLIDVAQKWIDARPVIVVADDSAENHVLLANYLKDKAYRISFVSNGLEAVNAFKRQRVSLFLMDMDMPIMDGYEAARTIRRLPDGITVPIVAITGYEGAEERLRCLSAGCSEYIAKPMRRREVVEVVSRLLDSPVVSPVEPFEAAIPELPGTTAPSLMPTAIPARETLRQKLRDLREKVPALRKHAAQGNTEILLTEMRTFESLADALDLREMSVVGAELRDAANRNDRRAIELWIDRLNDALKNSERIIAVRESNLLDSPAEENFDRLTRLASTVLRVPIALITIVDQDRQFFKSCIGLSEPWLSARETPLSHSFCQHVATKIEPLVVEDARLHPLVMDNLAIPDMDVIAYAGMPLLTIDGIALGSFCAIDTKPRKWSEHDLKMLRDLAALTVSQWERSTPGAE